MNDLRYRIYDYEADVWGKEPLSYAQLVSLTSITNDTAILVIATNKVVTMAEVHAQNLKQAETTSLNNKTAETLFTTKEEESVPSFEKYLKKRIDYMDCGILFFKLAYRLLVLAVIVSSLVGIAYALKEMRGFEGIVVSFIIAVLAIKLLEIRMNHFVDKKTEKLINSRNSDETTQRGGRKRRK